MPLSNETRDPDSTPDATSPETLSAVCRDADAAVASLRHMGVKSRARLLAAIAAQLEDHRTELVARADAETALGEERLHGELTRTTDQLRFLGSYAATCLNSLDRDSEGFIRSRRPIGPVAVYAASNFPFAFSVAGGDTASAIAAGCPVVVKAHPGHPLTSRRTADLVDQAISEFGAPSGTFAIIEGFQAGVELIQNPLIKAASFTGSLQGGRALADVAAARPEPIPFYGELGSINPVFVTERAARTRLNDIASGYADSYTLGAGQFCTKPGLIFVPRESGFTEAVLQAISGKQPARLLTEGIDAGYQAGLRRLATATERLTDADAPVQLFKTDATDAASSSVISDEVFGPVSVIAEYDQVGELPTFASRLPGSLTGTVHAEPEDAAEVQPLVETLSGVCGRVVWNGWPTGVAVNPLMHHGGPWPSSTAPLHTSVGASAIARFQVPVLYQGVPAALVQPP